MAGSSLLCEKRPRYDYNCAVSLRWTQHLLRYFLVTGLVACIAFIFGRLVHVDPTTVALIFLLGILFVANRFGLRYAIYMSVLAALAFNFFIFPPNLSHSLSTPRNWTTLVAFLVAGMLASHLSGRVKQQAHEADLRRREVERLYEFSQRLMIPNRLQDLLDHIPSYVRTSFQNDEVSLYLLAQNHIFRSGPTESSIEDHELRMAALSPEALLDLKQQSCITPLMLGLHSMGTIAIVGNLPSRATLDALGSLIAIAIERSTTAEQLSRTEAAQESERLRAALLDSVTHELRTPLTAIKASITTLRSGVIQEAAMQEEMLAVIEEETNRLNELIGQAVEMAQLDTRLIELHPRSRPIRDAIEAALHGLTGICGSHPIQIELPDSLPDAFFDIDWMRKVLHHLLENAAKYSEAGTTITLSAEFDEHSITTHVLDQGFGIDEQDQALIFDKFYRGQGMRYRIQGTGMGLAIVKAIVEAHGGKVSVKSQTGVGSEFSFSLPRRLQS